MSEWLGKPRIDEQDIRNSQPSLAEYFPMLTKYYVEDGQMRLVLTIPHEMRDKLVAGVNKTYGSFSPTNLRKAAFQALEQWLKTH